MWIEGGLFGILSSFLSLFHFVSLYILFYILRFQTDIYIWFWEDGILRKDDVLQEEVTLLSETQDRAGFWLMLTANPEECILLPLSLRFPFCHMENKWINAGIFNIYYLYIYSAKYTVNCILKGSSSPLFFLPFPILEGVKFRSQSSLEAHQGSVFLTAWFWQPRVSIGGR